MHAAVITDHAAPPSYAEFADPEPQDGEVVAEVRAAAVSNLVRALAAGRMYFGAARPPMIAGLDGVAQLPDGRLVYVPGVRGPWGVLAERAAVPLATARPVPDGLPATQAAAIVNAASASWLPLTRVLEPGASPTVLVLGATGASGSVAVPIAKHLGASRVVAFGRAGDKLERVRERGADLVLPIDGELDAALASVGADGVDIVLDFLWGDVAGAAMSTLTRTAPSPVRRLDWINIGAVAGTTFPFDATFTRMADLHVWGSGAGAYSIERRSAAVDAALELAARGVVAVDIEERPLARIEATWSEPGRLVYTPTTAPQ